MRRIVCCSLLLLTVFLSAAVCQEELKFFLRTEPKTFNPALVADESSLTIRYLTGGVLVRLAGGGLTALLGMQLGAECVLAVLALRAFARHLSVRELGSALRAPADRGVMGFLVPQGLNLSEGQIGEALVGRGSEERVLACLEAEQNADDFSISE